MTTTTTTLTIEEKIEALQSRRPQPQTTTYVYDTGKLVWQGTNQNPPYQYKGLPTQKVENTAEHKLAMDSYYKELNELYKEAYNDLADYMGWTNADEKVVAWIKSKIWSDGHSGGYGEVLNLASDYEELINILQASKS